VTSVESKDEKQTSRRLWLVRHGLTSWNVQQRFCGRSDIPLSARGRVQARWLARQLREKTIASIYTSDLARARETAEMIARQCLQPVQVNVSTAWRELDFGAWEGLTYAEIVAGFKDQLGFFTDPSSYAPPGGESLAHLVQRVQDALATIVCNQDASGKSDVVIVSHGGPLRVLLCRLLDMPLERQWQLRLDHGSLSAVDLLLPQSIQKSHQLPAPQATLVLLNAQRPMHVRRSSKTATGEIAVEVPSVEGEMPGD
jgi:alpha-ribazole phosphatase